MSLSTTFRGTKVLCSEDGRGNATVALKPFAKGEIVLQEPPLALVYPSDDLPWFKAMRKELEGHSKDCAWQYCVAAHCLVDAELPKPLPDGLKPLGADARVRLEELCGYDDDTKELEPSMLAVTTATHLIAASSSSGNIDKPALTSRIDEVAARVSRNGFQIMDLKRRPPTSADGLFHRISFCNHCCIGMNNAAWTWDGGDCVISVKATRDIAEGEELTISYIAKPWSDLAKSARQRYLQQNFNFTCLCEACRLPAEEEQELRKKMGLHKEEPKANSNNKLAGMLTRWMEQGQVEGANAGDAASMDKPVQTDMATTADKSDRPKGPLTEEERLSRVVARCARDGLEVSPDMAQAALSAEDGHVGKSIIRLRRQKLQAAQQDASQATEKIPARQITESVVPCVSIALAAFAAIALGAFWRGKRWS
jgi:hypothetical protein